MKNLFGTILLVIMFLISSCDSDQGCEEPALCGNGELNNYEECDSGYFPPMYSGDCTQWGYNGGYVFCTDSCTLDFSECEEYGVCGDGILSPLEECEGSIMPENQCTEIGHHSGELSCTDECTYDISGCQYCGDGIIQEEFGEECENDIIQDFECKDIGKWGSPLQCSSDCQFNDEYCNDVYFISQGFPGYNRFDTISDLTTDASGNLYVLGYTGSALEGFENSEPECTTRGYVELVGNCPAEEIFIPCWDNFLYKLSPDGTILWKKQWGTTGDDRGFAIFNTGTTIKTLIFSETVFTEYYKNTYFPYHLSINQASFLSFDYAGNQLNSKSVPVDVTDPRKIIPFGNKILVSGNNGIFEPEQVLYFIDPETGTETSLLPDATPLSGVVLDNAVLDSTWLATLVHDEGEMELSKINIHDGSRIMLNTSPDNHTVSVMSEWDYNIYRTPPSLLLKHNNSDLYYITQEKLSDSTCISTLFRVTADGSKLAEYVFPDYNTPFSNYNLAQTDNGNLVITRTFSQADNIDSADIPPDYYGEIIEVTIIEENLLTPETHYKNINNHHFETGNNTDEVAGIECFGDYVYIFGRRGVEKVQGFIWRLGLDVN